MIVSVRGINIFGKSISGGKELGLEKEWIEGEKRGKGDGPRLASSGIIPKIREENSNEKSLVCYGGKRNRRKTQGGG